MERYLVGVDLGTSATKAAIYKTDGTLVAEASVEVALHHPKPGVVEQETDDFYTSAARTVKRCIETSGVDPRRIAAIAFDSQMAGIGTVDEDFRPATRYDSWLDMRCQPYIEHMETQAERVTRITGCPPTCDHGPKMLWWQGERPDDFRRIAKFVVPAGYVAGRMAGLRGDHAFIDHTFVHFSGFVDAQRGVWSDELCATFGLDPSKLARIVAPSDIIGDVQEAAARDFGLMPGTPIAAGAGDTAAGALGAGSVRPGMLLDTAGTAAVLAACTDSFAADVEHRALLTMRSVVPGLWHPLAYTAGGGLALRWFRDNFYNTRRGEAQPLESDLYAEMIGMAASVPPGAEGLFFSPHLGGRICPSNPAMRGVWAGFSWKHTQAHFARAILEGVAFEYAYYLRILCELLPNLSLSEARVIGGGARSPVWNGIKADVLDVPFQRLKRSEFATWGCALIAGHAVGIFPDLAEAAARTTEPDGVAITPSPDRGSYEPLIDAYMAWQDTLSSAFRTIPNEE